MDDWRRAVGAAASPPSGDLRAREDMISLGFIQRGTLPGGGCRLAAEEVEVVKRGER